MTLMNIDVGATTLQLLGAIFVSIDAFTKEETYKNWRLVTERFITEKFTSVSEFKRTRTKRLLVLFFFIILLFLITTLSLPKMVIFSASLASENYLGSIITLVIILSTWIFLYGMAAQAVLLSLKESPLVFKYYMGVFLLYSDRGPLYVIGFISIVFGYSLQLFSQITMS